MADSYDLCYRYRNYKLFLTSISCDDEASCCYQDRVFTLTDKTLTTNTACKTSWTRCLGETAANTDSQGLSELEKIWLAVICVLIAIALLIILYFLYRLLRLKTQREKETQVETKSISDNMGGEMMVNVENVNEKLVHAGQIFVTNATMRPLTNDCDQSPITLSDKLSFLIRNKDELKLGAFLETVKEFYSGQLEDEQIENGKGILDAWRYERELKDTCTIRELSESDTIQLQRTLQFLEGFLYKSHIHADILHNATQKLGAALQKQEIVNDIKTRVSEAIQHNDLEELETLVDLIRAKQLDRECEKELCYAQNVFEKNCKNAKILVERDLTSAMGKRETLALKRAIKRAEQSEYKAELENKLYDAKQVMDELEDIEKFKNLHKLKMCNAIKSGDLNRMEQALQNVKMDGFGEDLKVEICDLEMALKRRYLKKRLKGHMNVAIQNLDLVKLRRAVNEATAAGFLNELGLELEMAQGLLTQLERIELIRKAVLELTNAHIAEIKSYTAPPVQVHKVLMSLLIVLGEDPEVVRDWFEIQVILVKTGKLSLKRRVQEYDPANLTSANARRAAKLLTDIDKDELHTISRVAKVFYLWTSTVVEDRLSMDLPLTGNDL